MNMQTTNGKIINIAHTINYRITHTIIFCCLLWQYLAFTTMLVVQTLKSLRDKLIVTISKTHQKSVHTRQTRVHQGNIET